jgi:septum formation protein
MYICVMIDTSPYKLVLGSKSPRRCQLMEEAGFEFTVRTADTDENFDPSMPVLEVASHLAERKARALESTIRENEILITADSIVILDNVIYNKPADYDEAIAMLNKLSGHRHTVATGVTILMEGKATTFTAITHVTMSVMSADEMDFYISKYQPYDKAGSYGIQDWIGLCKISGIEGSYSNVMGLPVHDLYHQLRKMLSRL